MCTCARARATAVVCDACAVALAHEGVLCARREEDPISATLKVITLIKAVMCGDGQAGEGGGEAGGGGGSCHFFYGAAWGALDLRESGKEGGVRGVQGLKENWE